MVTLTFDVIGSCEFTAFVDESDGVGMLERAEAGVQSWIEEVGVTRGDYAVVVNGETSQPLGCVHTLEAVVPSELADEIMELAQDHEATVGDSIMVVRRR